MRMKEFLRKWYDPYGASLLACVVFLVFAFAVDTPANIGAGFVRILTSRSLLNTDYVVVGGLGAAFFNAALTGAQAILVMMLAKARPNGANVMAVWLTTAFAFFGKNILNGIPIHFGVFLYARYQKEPFGNYALNAVLASTLSPVVSELIFMDWRGQPFDALIGIGVGIAVGFIMPVITSSVTKIHGGYLLYNVGFSGGIVALLIMAVISNAGINISRPTLWSQGNNLVLGIFLSCFMVGWMLFSFISSKRRTLKDFKAILGHSGRLVTDYYLLYGDSVYFNMGLCGLLGILFTLCLGAELNGATMAGIFTMMGFGAFGKHVKNCFPVMVGAAIAALFNPPPPTEPGNILAILFCTGLAPIAGQYGWFWGLITGFLHLALFNHVGWITGGFNLYNNGFTGAFVAIMLLPLIRAFKKGRDLRLSRRSGENEP